MMEVLGREAVDGVPVPAEAGAEHPLVHSKEFEDAFGEPLARTLDLDTWQPGDNLDDVYQRLEREIADAVRQEDRIRSRVRSEIFPRLRTRPAAPPGAGVYSAGVEDLEQIHRGLLFAGRVEACDGTSIVHDTLPITIAQIGVCLVSYQGNQASWMHRLYRRDLRIAGVDPVSETLEVLERRRAREGLQGDSSRDTLSDLARRGIMAYAERAVLLHRASAPWLMGHGNPAPYELLTGSGMCELLETSLDLLEALILGHQRFVFVPSAPRARLLLTLGNALRPLEYAIADTLQEQLERLVERGHYRGEWKFLAKKLKDFAQMAGREVVVGTYRASAVAPPQVFYAHVNHAHEAALIALSDSVLQEYRGFPMLIDLADHICSVTFGADSFLGLAQLAYVEAGEPLRYIAERRTRPG